MCLGERVKLVPLRGQPVVFRGHPQRLERRHDVAGRHRPRLTGLAQRALPVTAVVESKPLEDHRGAQIVADDVAEQTIGGGLMGRFHVTFLRMNRVCRNHAIGRTVVWV
jgi:hypothetical protein